LYTLGKGVDMNMITLDTMEEILRGRVVKLKRDYASKGKLEYLMRIKEAKAILNYVRKLNAVRHE
jgi:hypothetical protein